MIFIGYYIEQRPPVTVIQTEIHAKNVVEGYSVTERI